jgi:cell division GTPase FtsZ
MKILLLGVGGGGGSIAKSVKALFRRDVAVTQQSDAKYADRLRRAVTTRFLDTNVFSLADVPREERVVIGAQTTGQLGARHNPEVARLALEESRREVEALIASYSAVIVVGTGGKGTGAGTMFPIAQIAREQHKLLIPIFVRPSFERHEVDKRRYDHALGVVKQFDEARIRLIEILNDHGYVERSPEPQAVVWERMNLPIARGLRALIYVLSDLSQVDPSDLSALLAGNGRLRLGSAVIDPSHGDEPTEAQVADAVAECWRNPYYAFDKPLGTSLICIQGNWSNVADASIKGGLAALAASDGLDGHYVPLHARAPHAPRPWGVTALFAEYTGVHAPLAIDWTLDDRMAPLIGTEARPAAEPVAARPTVVNVAESPASHLAQPQARATPVESQTFESLWEFAVAVNRGAPAALRQAAEDEVPGFEVDGHEVRKLVRTVWFRTVLPRLSAEWRERLLAAMVAAGPIPNHQLKQDRREVRIGDLSYEELKGLVARIQLPESARADIDLLLAVGRLWGESSLARFAFADIDASGGRSRLAHVLAALRK